MEEENVRFFSEPIDNIREMINSCGEAPIRYKLRARIDVNEGNAVQTQLIDIPGKNDYFENEAEAYASYLNKEYQTFMKTDSINLIERKLTIESITEQLINKNYLL